MTAPTLPPTTSEEAPGPDGHRTRGLRRVLGGAGARVRTVATRLREMPGRGTPAAWAMGPLAALWAAVIGFGLAAIPMLIVWMATPQSGLTWVESLHVAGLLWVVAQGAPVVLGGVT